MSGSIRDREAILREDYDAVGVAKNYSGARWTETQHARRTHRIEHAWAKRFLRWAGPLGIILDLPCGTGRFSRLLQTHAPKLLQVDQSEAMLGQMSGPRAQGAISRIPLANDSVDLAFCFRLLHHFPESVQRKEALSELARVSRRWVIASYFDRSCFQAWRHRVRGRKSNRFPQSRKTFQDEAELAGLRVVREGFIARGISEQVVVLLEKMECSDGVFKPFVQTETSSVEKRTLSNGQSHFVKRYDFPKPLRRLEAAFRHTWRSPSRAEREFLNLQKMRELGISVVQPIDWWERRDSFGFVRESWLATEAVEAPDLDTYLQAGNQPSTAYFHALVESVRAISQAGILYRGLRARNVLVTDNGPVWLDPAKASFQQNPQSVALTNEKEFREEIRRLGLD
ncbi:MAG TPA: class I SAM-dependent methyltransferase [Planctomycetota bacterium]|nr:hypothetical protein [Planctomycetota bacterium]MDP7245416.1 class I SAM-dependent methyltransferase [Planctomycetota bacterium]HJM39180.1 class I SAM-dependent methyltransferase [Planctomycetota bacterium]